MLEHITNEPDKLEAGVSDAPTKDDLLNRAKLEIDKSEGRVRLAAEALAQAEKEFGSTQKEMADVIGRSQSYVAKLLKWHHSGFEESSPFGPTTKAGREAQYSHGNKKSHKASEDDTRDDNLDKIRKARFAKMGSNADRLGDHDPAEEASGDDDAAAEPDVSVEAELGDASANAMAWLVTPTEALASLKDAIDQWFRFLDDAGRSEVAAYLMAQERMQ